MNTLTRQFRSLCFLASIRLRSLVRNEPLSKDLNLLLDCDYYRATNPDVAGSRWPARLHYFLFGGFEGRNPHRLFDTKHYLSSSSDVRASGVNPLLHYILFGATEGRSPHPSFDGARYMRNHPEIARLRINPLADFLRN